MAAPLYSGVNAPLRTREGHPGLWYDRFFHGYPPGWKSEPQDKRAKDAWAQAKTDWINAMATAVGDSDACSQACERLSRLCLALGGESRVYGTDWHFVTGLGNPHPVENGFLWHPTLGTPYIPGAAVKGLVRAWVEAWMFDEVDQRDERRALLARWFGSSDKDFKTRKEIRQRDGRTPAPGPNLETTVGAFIFFDALPIEPVRLRADVMTPHMGKWYELGGEVDDVSARPERIPADWHDPVPVCFLVADRPELQFSIAPQTDAAKPEIAAVHEALACALAWLGAGAKTAVGYGVMTRKQDSEQRLYLDSQRRDLLARAAAEEARVTAEREASIAAMDPLEREIHQFLDRRTDKSQRETSAIIAAVRQGMWAGEQRRDVAHWLEQRMRSEKGQWKPQSQAKRPEKDREHQNTLLVIEWLTKR